MHGVQQDPADHLPRELDMIDCQQLLAAIAACRRSKALAPAPERSAGDSRRMLGNVAASAAELRSNLQAQGLTPEADAGGDSILSLSQRHPWLTLVLCPAAHSA